VASVLGIREQPRVALADTLAEVLRDRQLLLVLDNCEHQIEACAILVHRLLQSSSSPRILAASREPLDTVSAMPLAPLNRIAREVEAVTKGGDFMQGKDRPQMRLVLRS
jgi:predicted ATPase